jgi:transcriptional regulator with XRE-family HTH domain
MDSISEVFLFNQPLTQGQKVRIARIARRWTQDDLAFEAQVTQGLVSALERDLRVYPAAKERILQALELESGQDD